MASPLTGHACRGGHNMGTDWLNPATWLGFSQSVPKLCPSLHLCSVKTWRGLLPLVGHSPLYTKGYQEANFCKGIWLQTRCYLNCPLPQNSCHVWGQVCPFAIFVPCIGGIGQYWVQIKRLSCNHTIIWICPSVRLLPIYSAVFGPIDPKFGRNILQFPMIIL